MAGFFTGVASVPISTLIMVSEVTGNYRLMLPAMWVEAITFTLCYRVSLYRAQVPSRKDSPAHRGDFIIDLLGGLTVESVQDGPNACDECTESVSPHTYVGRAYERHQQSENGDGCRRQADFRQPGRYRIKDRGDDELLGHYLLDGTE